MGEKLFMERGGRQVFRNFGEEKMKPVLTIEFDDCFEETISSVLPVLKKFRFKASFAVIANRIGGELEGIKLADQKGIKRVINYKHEIVSHTLSHGALARKKILSIQNLLNLLHLKKISHLKKVFLLKKYHNPKKNWNEEIIESKKKLKGFYPICSLTYPGGAYNRDTIKTTRKEYSSARSVNRGFNDENSNPYELKSMLWDRGTKIAEANKWIDNTISKGKWLIETFHLVSDNNKGKYEYFTRLTDFIKHLEYINKRVLEGKIVVKTRKEVVEELNRKAMKK